MISSRPELFQLIPISMSVSASIVKQASAPYEMRNLAAKIVAYSMIFFILITAFEAFVINGAKTLINSAITLMNSAHRLIFSKSELDNEILEPFVTVRAEQVEEAEELLPVEINMPKISYQDRQKVEWIVRTLGDNSLIEIFKQKSKLEETGEEIMHLHPFQLLETVFGQYSVIKPQIARVMDDVFIGKNFLAGLEDGIQNTKYPEHKTMLRAYIPSFSRSVGVHPEKTHSFLSPTRNWEGLVTHLVSIHCPQVLD
jgi:hypothetical protein